MKKTKEIEIEENPVEKILKFESLEDAKEFEYVASGRKFCKRGERILDICEDELENYICRDSANIILKLYLHHKLKKNKTKLESRITSVIRALAVELLNKDDDVSEDELTKKVKETILGQVEKYKETLGIK